MIERLWKPFKTPPCDTSSRVLLDEWGFTRKSLSLRSDSQSQEAHPKRYARKSKPSFLRPAIRTNSPDAQGTRRIHGCEIDRSEYRSKSNSDECGISIIRPPFSHPPGLVSQLKPEAVRRLGNSVSWMAMGRAD